jgi:hypothetical protein
MQIYRASMEAEPAMPDTKISDTRHSPEVLQATGLEIPPYITPGLAASTTSEESLKNAEATPMLCAACNNNIHKRTLRGLPIWCHNPGTLSSGKRQPEHEWHEAMKAYFPNCQEVTVFAESPERRYKRPDARPSVDLAFEAQYSYISLKKILDRNRFYSQDIIWLVHLHFCNCIGSWFETYFIEPSKAAATFPETDILVWPRPRKGFFNKWLEASKTTKGVFFDPGTGILWRLTGNQSQFQYEYNGEPVQGAGPAKLTPIRRAFLLTELNRGRPLADILQDGMGIENLEPLSDLSWQPFGPFNFPHENHADLEGLIDYHRYLIVCRGEEIRRRTASLLSSTISKGSNQILVRKHQAVPKHNEDGEMLNQA